MEAPPSAKVGASFMVEGFLNTEHGVPIDGQPIDVYVNGVKVETVRTGWVLLKGSGYYSRSQAFAKPGDYIFQAKYLGNPGYAGSSSPRIGVRR